MGETLVPIKTMNGHALVDTYSREQIDQLSAEIGDVIERENLSSRYEDFAGQYLNPSGTTYASAAAGTTDYIPVVYGDVFYWSGTVDLNGSRAVCVYDENKNFIEGYTLADKGYHATYSVKFVVTEGSYVRFSTLSATVRELYRDKSYDGIYAIEDKTEQYTANLVDGYIDHKGDVVTGAGGVTTDFIPANDGDVFLVSCYVQWAVNGCAFYNENQNFIQTFLHNADESELIAKNERVVAPSGTAYVRFCTFYPDDYPLVVQKYEATNLKNAVSRLDEMVKATQCGNVLFGKKYVACGDSFTEGSFSSKTEETWDNDMQMYKTYPYWIAKRNQMVLVNEAKSGSDFTNAEGASNPFSASRYLEVPHDADYITLMFGLNETTVDIGTKTDTTNATLWGAYNIVFEHFLTNMPFAKIGVIIADAWMPESYANAVKEICDYWGIPYLDLKDDSVPMGIGGRYSETSLRARELRNAAFQVSEEDSHPNPKAHEYRSYIVENFLRSMTSSGVRHVSSEMNNVNVTAESIVSALGYVPADAGTCAPAVVVSSNSSTITDAIGGYASSIIVNLSPVLEDGSLAPNPTGGRFAPLTEATLNVNGVEKRVNVTGSPYAGTVDFVTGETKSAGVRIYQGSELFELSAATTPGTNSQGLKYIRVQPRFGLDFDLVNLFVACNRYVVKNESPYLDKSIRMNSNQPYIYDNDIDFDNPLAVLDGAEFMLYEGEGETFSGTGQTITLEKGENIFTSDSGSVVSVSYGVDTKTYIDKKFAELSAALLGG